MINIRRLFRCRGSDKDEDLTFRSTRESVGWVGAQSHSRRVIDAFTKYLIDLNTFTLIIPLMSYNNGP